MAAKNNIPRHVAVIMDGNGRWARKRALPRHVGHRSGVGAVRATVERAAERGVGYLTLFAFSSENWRRPREEVSKLMGLFLEALQREVDELHRNNVRLEFIGAREQLQPRLIEKIAAAEKQTVLFTICEKCGNVQELVNNSLVNAVKDMARDIDFSLKKSVIELRGICASCRDT